MKRFQQIINGPFGMALAITAVLVLSVLAELINPYMV